MNVIFRNFLNWVTMDPPRNQWVGLKIPKLLMLYYIIIFHCLCSLHVHYYLCFAVLLAYSYCHAYQSVLALYKHSILPHKPENTISFVIFETKETNGE